MATFDPLDPATIENPYPAYAELRERQPVAYLSDHDIWVTTRYQHVHEVLRQPSLYSSAAGMGRSLDDRHEPETGVGFRMGPPGVRVLVATDPPEHRRIRSALMPAFAGAVVDRMSASVDRLAEEVVDNFLSRAEAGSADFFRDVSDPMPALVLSDVLGVPRAMREDFRAWVQLVATDLDQASSKQHLGAGLDMLRYFRSEIKNRQGRPENERGGANLLDLLADATRAGLTEREVLANCVFLLVAGIETTTNLLSNFMAVLTSQDDVQSLLRREPALIPSAIEETLRYDAPVQALWRATTQETSIDGQVLPAGARLLVAFGAANRDPRHFTNPDEFWPARSPNEHLAFGHGPHFCIGARLARLEASAMIRAVLRRTSWISARGPQERTRSLILRGFVRQGVAVS